MFKNCLVLISLLICFGQISCVLNPKVICYYEDWWVWRNGNGKMTVDDVDSSLCTHIVYAYLGVSNNYEVSLPDSYLMLDKKDLEKFVNNKGNSKALIAIGGYSLTANMDPMITTESRRSTFINSVDTFIKRYNFDGISFDWSRVTWEEKDFDEYVKFLKELHAKFDGKYILGITEPARPVNFKADRIDKYVDFISVQTFDFHGSWERIVGHQAPLNWQISTLREWEKAGASPHKLIMTIPLFAHTWLLSETSNTKPGANAIGPGKMGPWSQAEGKLSYNELCTEVKKNPSAFQFKTDAKESDAPYIIHDSTWITCETTSTCKDKAHNVTTEGYGGVVVQALANEDFRGLCGTKYPLLKAINEGLNKEDIKERTHPPIITTERPIVTVDPHKLCHKPGFVRDPKHCNIYHKCTEFFPGVVTDEENTCPSGEAFDMKEEKCKNEKQVDCN